MTFKFPCGARRTGSARIAPVFVLAACVVLAGLASGCGRKADGREGAAGAKPGAGRAGAAGAPGAPGGAGGAGGRPGKAPGRPAMPPMPVETAEATSSSVVDRFQAVGTLEAAEQIAVSPEIDGLVVELPFREGAEIARGGLIARLDDTQLRAEADRAEALRDQSRAGYERVKSVVDAHAGAPQDLDDAAAALKVAEANLSLAKARLSKTRIVAPFDGIAGARNVSPGAFLRAGTSITDLARIRELRADFSVPERYLGRLAAGAEVTVSTTAYPGEEVTGKIFVIEPTVDPATRSARVVARIDNAQGRFRPGMSANISAVLSRRDAALTIPNEAVFVEGDQALVYAVRADSTVTRVPLTLGTRTADRVEVVSGLDPGTRVVRAGHQKLFEGAKVMPVTSRTEAAGR